MVDEDPLLRCAVGWRHKISGPITAHGRPTSIGTHTQIMFCAFCDKCGLRISTHATIKMVAEAGFSWSAATWRTDAYTIEEEPC